MGFLDQFFGKSDVSEDVQTSWQELENVEEYRDALSKSFEKPILFFKHSTTCFISKSVKKNLEKQISHSDDKDKVDLYYLDLLHFRPISNLMANDLNVTHQSPQAILVVNGHLKYDASHDNIDFDQVLQALK
ncbi:bacillithiol system redox-active protein YtxJ [Halpernia frigidisoli]|uniref:Bacillithiol system protein YtxJ n=1 Tax=Halpernia frigidisoli TaxID=1125876 RepID=A0A1I3DUY5_9FLAO|nr:bacillithiol system redox-active protein YtxJ [Halpernia frigidisoli]SFH90515.1 bacillithiol system protein YtxJ [Halpernia frigidisoli]